MTGELCQNMLCMRHQVKQLSIELHVERALQMPDKFAS